MHYNFDRTWWLKWYWPFIEHLYEVEGHYGTRWSAKSHNISRKLLYHSFQPYQFNVIHGRKVYGDIEGSTFRLLCELINKHFPNDFIIRKNHFEIINKRTGNWFRGLGMDKSEKAKGVEGANIAWLEEANQFTREDADYIATTIRGSKDVPISLILSWNPESKNHWLYQEVQSKKDLPNHIYHKSSFWNNYTINREAFHERLLRIKDGSSEGERRYKVWGLGDWGAEDLEKTFLNAFDSEKMVFKGKLPVIEGLPIYLSFDFNVTNTCGVNQFALSRPGEKYYASITRLGTHRMGDLGSMCEHLKSLYPNHEFIINGDANGRAKSAYTKDNVSAYQQIRSYLKIEDERFQVDPQNFTHIRSRTLCNVVLLRCKFLIQEQGNEIFIADCKEAEVDRNGSLDPWKTKHPNMGHSFDEWRYFIQRNFKELAGYYTI